MDLLIGLFFLVIFIGVATSTGSLALRVVGWVAVAMTLGILVLRLAEGESVRRVHRRRERRSRAPDGAN